MNGKWIEVFRVGNHTASNGSVKNWTEADLDTIVAKYNGQAAHEAPVVVGHPEHNSPAFGYAEELKRDGKQLLAKLKQVPDAFTELVKQGTYKKRSISLYPDLTLRHIGFLGGMPPAVKGLADIAFRDGEQPITFEFSDWRMSTIGRIVMKMRDYLVEKEGAEKADNIISSWEVQDLLTPPPEHDEASTIGSYQEHQEVDMKVEEVQALIDKSLERVTASFSEQLKGIADGMKGITASFSELQKVQKDAADATARTEFTAFCEGLKTRILPAEIPTIVDQMMNLRSAEPLKFNEGGQEKTVSAVDDFKSRLQSRAETIQFGEFAERTRAGERQAGSDDAVVLARKASDFQESEAKAGRTVTLSQALLHVEAEMAGGAK